MFKKPFEIRNHRRLSGADIKKLRRSLLEKFPATSEEDLDAILPLKAEVLVDRLVNHAIIYSVEGGLPMIFDANGKGDLFPTVYAMWKAPNMVPCFMLKGAEVSRYVLGGADLMVPGINVGPEGLPPFEKGEIWGVLVPGNMYPVAVGETLTSSAAATRVGLKGKALHLLHYYGDQLWEKAEVPFTPNEGFGAGIVQADPTATAGPGADGSDMVTEPLANVDQRLADNSPLSEENRLTAGNSSLEHEDGGEADSDTGHRRGADWLAMSELSVRDSHPREREDDAQSEEVMAPGELIEAENTVPAAEPALTVVDMDALLDNCLLQALKTTVTTSELPLHGSTLWASHILPCRPPSTTLDIKKSSHKKLSKWLLSKTSEGLIAAKEDKHTKEMILTAVNRKHPAYRSFNVEQIASAPSPLEDALTTQVEEVWKVSHHVTLVFEAVGADTGLIYTTPEAEGVVREYVGKANLDIGPDGATVRLDAILCDALFKGAIKKGTAYPTSVRIRDLGKLFLGRLHAHHRVTRGDKSVVRKGALQKVEIVTERRQGNKKVTRVTGFESFLVPADALAADLAKKFASSTSVGDIPGRKDHEVLVQGGVPEQLGLYLVEHYGIPKEFVRLMDKTSK